MAEKSQKKVFASINYLRIIACFLVLATHTNYIISNGSAQNTNNYFLLLYNIIAKTAVPIFFMISGALQLSKDYSYKDMIKKAMNRIILPLLIFSLVIHFKRNPSLDVNNIMNFIKYFLSNQILFPYWFLYTLFGLYIVTPILRKCVSLLKDNDYKVYFALSVILLSILPVFNHYNLIPTNKHLMIGLICIPMLYYILGYFIYNILEKIGKTKELIISLIIFTVVAITPLIIIFDAKNGYGNTYWYDLASIPVFSLSLLFTYLFKFYVNSNFKLSFLNKVIDEISKNTLYIYMMQGILLGHFEFIYNFLVRHIHINNFILLLIYQIILFIILNIFASIIRGILLIIKKGEILWQKKN